MADISEPDPAANDHVNDVAELMPFGEAYVEDVAVGVVQIDLGSRLGEDWPHDRAGVDGTGPEHRWWIETMAGEQQDFSGPAATAPPAEIAAWVTRRAHAFDSPAAVQDRTVRTISLDHRTREILGDEILKYSRWLEGTSFDENDFAAAEARGHRLDVPVDIFYTMHAGIDLDPDPKLTLGNKHTETRLSEVFHHAGWTPENAPEPVRELVAEVDRDMRRYLGVDLEARVLQAALDTEARDPFVDDDFAQERGATTSQHEQIRAAVREADLPEPVVKLITQMSNQIEELQKKLAETDSRVENLSGRETQTRQALVNVARRLELPEPAPTRATDATGPVVDHRSATTRGASVD